MIAAEVSRPECSKLRELEFERNFNFFHQIMSFKALISHAVFELSPRTSDSPEGVLQMGSLENFAYMRTKKHPLLLNLSFCEMSSCSFFILYFVWKKSCSAGSEACLILIRLSEVLDKSASTAQTFEIQRSITIQFILEKNSVIWIK